MEILRNKIDGLLKEKEELSDILDKRNTELEKLQTKSAAEHITAELRLREACDEIERWKERENEVQREKEELNQKFIEGVERESHNLKITERERATMSDLLRKKEDEIRTRGEDIEELKTKVQSHERTIESLEIELQEKRPWRVD